MAQVELCVSNDLPALGVLTAAADELSPAPSLDGLEEPASAGPVLVTVDNVQWADLATTQALRSMPWLLASYPLLFAAAFVPWLTTRIS